MSVAKNPDTFDKELSNWYERNKDALREARSKGKTEVVELDGIQVTVTTPAMEILDPFRITQVAEELPLEYDEEMNMMVYRKNGEVVFAIPIPDQSIMYKGEKVYRLINREWREVPKESISPDEGGPIYVKL